MENELEFSARDKVAVVVVTAAVIYSTYHLGRLGAALTREGYRTLKSKMNSDK